MGTSPRTRRAYRVLDARRTKGMAALGIVTWRISVEPISADAGRAEIAAGAHFWSLVWDHRKR